MSTSLDPRTWRRVLVYGLGLSGRAAARLLSGQGVEVVGVDDRPAGELATAGLEGLPGLELLLGAAAPAEVPAGVEALVLSPGVPPGRPLVADARRRGVPVVAEVELAFHHATGPVVGITGSNGKSTTTALAGAMLAAAGREVAVCGNIGRPFAEAVAEAAAETVTDQGPPERVYVVELSSFQLETLHRFRPRAAAWLNLAPDHLDRYPDLEAYAAAKASLIERVGREGVAVLNRDDPRVAAAASPGRRRFFSRLGPVEDGCHLEGDRVVETDPAGGGGGELFRRADLPLAGEHNLENAMAAALLARALGAGGEAIRRGMGGFAGLPHRMERVVEIGGVAFVDDSKGTNPAATVRSLEGLPDGSVHLILGGLSKGADLSGLAAAVGRKARRVYLIGQAAPELEVALGGAAPAETDGTLDRAVAAAAGRARAGEVVLLSPACASFDQFDNFAQRGEVFQQIVRGLAGAAVEDGAAIIKEGKVGQEAGV